MNFDDPKLTAYALGELEAAEEIAAIEALLQEHPELAAEMEETRMVGEWLRRELKADTEAKLTHAQREEVFAAAVSLNGSENTTRATQPTVTVFPWWRRHWVPSAVAATVVLTTSIATLWKMQQPHFVQIDVSPAAVPQEERPVVALATPSEPSNNQSPSFTLAPATPLPQAVETEKQKIERLFSEAENFRNTGRYDLAYKRAEQILETDRYNVSARKLQEEINQKRRDYAIAGMNHTRSYLTWQAANKPVIPSEQALVPPLSTPESKFGRIAGESIGAAAPAPKPTVRERAKEERGRVAFSLAPNDPAPMSEPQLPADSTTAAYGDQPSKTAGGTLNTGQALTSLAKLTPSAAPGSAAPATAYGGGAVELLSTVSTPYLPDDSVFRQQNEPSNTESYDNITDNAFLAVRDNPLSTFSIDVDTASYSNVRRFLTFNQRPPKGAVRIEELVNYFPYDYPQPQGEDPFSCTLEVGTCPWTPQHRLVRVGLKGREIAKEKLPPSNLVFLIDVSGSMRPANKLPLVKECLQQLVSNLREQDSVGIVVYAGSSGILLEPTNDKAAVRAALDRLEAGGSTNGASGIQGAYDLAQRAFKKDGNNRVVLCTDGDFNVGVASQSELVDLIRRRAKGGVFLSVLGFGMGNTKDSTMEKLADKGNGNYAYIDSAKEGRKVLVEQMAGTLFTIAKDVKIQVEFNPAQVGAYRLIGYENRILAKEDFNDDTKDAGEIGAGHTVTALYEIVPVGTQLPINSNVDPLKYQQPSGTAETFTGKSTEASSATSTNPEAPAVAGRKEATQELLTLKLRFKEPDRDKSVLREFPLTDPGSAGDKISADYRWAAAVASFGMILRDSPHRGNATWESVAELAQQGKGADPAGYRTEFLQLIDRARQLVPITPLPVPKQDSGKDARTEGKAGSLVVPEFDLSDAPLLDAIDTLAKKSRELDPAGKGVSIMFAGNNSTAQTKVSLRMRATSVLEIAKAIATTVGLSLVEQGEILIIRAEQR